MFTSKRMLAAILGVLMILTLAPTAMAAAKITIKVDGTAIATDIAPIVSGNAILVSTKTVSDGLGADVSYSASKKTATVTTAAFKFVFTMNSTSYTVNGAAKTLDVAPKLSGNKPMVPIKAIVTDIGGAYAFSNNAVSISYFTKIQGTAKVTGSTTVQPIAQAAADKLKAMNGGLLISVAGGGSGAGINDTTKGNNNVGMSSRELTANEAAAIKAVAIANDGIAIIVHPSNKVKNLTKEQAAKIFLGEITNWKDVGGADAPILVQTRETGSGTRATLEEMLLEKKSVVKTATPYASSALIKQGVATEKNAIGFDSIGFVDKSVKALSLDNIAPTIETVKNGSYPMSRSLFVLYKGTPSSQGAVFIDYLKTLACQKNIVAKEGYIAIK